MAVLFIAFPAGNDLIGNFREQHDFLLKFKDDIRTVNRENYHVTLKYLGDCSVSLASEISDGFRGLDISIKKISIRAKGLGVFPDMGSARVIWCGLETEGPVIQNIYKTIEVFSGRFGFVREKRGFTPHLTLARVKKAKSLPAELSGYIAENWDTYFTDSIFDRVSLYESRFKDGGPVYVELVSIPFE